MSDEDLERLAADDVPFAVNPRSLEPMLGLAQGWGLPLCGTVGKIKTVDRTLANQETGLKERGVAAGSKTPEGDAGWKAVVVDPDGNTLALIEVSAQA